jgi:hypothetical protein
MRTGRFYPQPRDSRGLGPICSLRWICAPDQVFGMSGFVVRTQRLVQGGRTARAPQRLCSGNSRRRRHRHTTPEAVATFLLVRIPGIFTVLREDRNASIPRRLESVFLLSHRLLK